MYKNYNVAHVVKDGEDIFIPGTPNNRLQIDVWWNNHFLCKDWESSNWNNHKEQVAWSSYPIRSHYFG